MEMSDHVAERLASVVPDRGVFNCQQGVIPASTAGRSFGELIWASLVIRPTLRVQVCVPTQWYR